MKFFLWEHLASHSPIIISISFSVFHIDILKFNEVWSLLTFFIDRFRLTLLEPWKSWIYANRWILMHQHWLEISKYITICGISIWLCEPLFACSEVLVHFNIWYIEHEYFYGVTKYKIETVFSIQRNMNLSSMWKLEILCVPVFQWNSNVRNSIVYCVCHENWNESQFSKFKMKIDVKYTKSQVSEICIYWKL